jgi:hypothetical protein
MNNTNSVEEVIEKVKNIKVELAKSDKDKKILDDLIHNLKMLTSSDQ